MTLCSSTRSLRSRTMLATWIASAKRVLAYVSKLSPEERNNTLKRIAENRAVVLSVRRSLAERTESYKIALERLVIEAPSPVAVEAERSLKLLQQRISAYSA